MHVRVFGLALLSARRSRVWCLVPANRGSPTHKWAPFVCVLAPREKRDLAAFLLSLAERGILHALGQAQSPIQETKRDKFARDGPGRGTARLPIMPQLDPCMHAASMDSTINDHMEIPSPNFFLSYWLVLVIACTLDAGLQALLTILLIVT